MQLAMLPIPRVMFADLLLACYLVNATCAIINIMANLIFTIVSLLEMETQMVGENHVFRRLEDFQRRS